MMTASTCDRKRKKGTTNIHKHTSHGRKSTDIKSTIESNYEITCNNVSNENTSPWNIYLENNGKRRGMDGDYEIIMQNFVH